MKDDSQLPPCYHVDSLLNSPGNYVVDAAWEPLEDTPSECAKCGAPMRLWYQDIYNSDNEHLDRLPLYRCARWKSCRHKFYLCQ